MSSFQRPCSLLPLFALLFFSCGESKYADELRYRLAFSLDAYSKKLEENKKKIETETTQARAQFSLRGNDSLDLNQNKTVKQKILKLGKEQVENLGNLLTESFLEHSLLAPFYKKSSLSGETFYFSKRLQVENKVYFIAYFLKQKTSKDFLSYPILFSSGDPSVSTTPQLEPLLGKLLKELSATLLGKKTKLFDEAYLVLKRKHPKKLTSKETDEFQALLDKIQKEKLPHFLFENTFREHQFLPEKTEGISLKNICEIWD